MASFFNVAYSKYFCAKLIDFLPLIKSVPQFLIKGKLDYNLDSKKYIVKVGVEVDGFDLNGFWPNSKLESTELRVEQLTVYNIICYKMYEDVLVTYQ